MLNTLMENRILSNMQYKLTIIVQTWPQDDKPANY